MDDSPHDHTTRRAATNAVAVQTGTSWTPSFTNPSAVAPIPRTTPTPTPWMPRATPLATFSAASKVAMYSSSDMICDDAASNASWTWIIRLLANKVVSTHISRAGSVPLHACAAIAVARSAERETIDSAVLAPMSTPPAMAEETVPPSLKHPEHANAYEVTYALCRCPTRVSPPAVTREAAASDIRKAVNRVVAQTVERAMQSVTALRYVPK